MRPLVVVRPFRAHARMRVEPVLSALLSAGIAPAREGRVRCNRTGTVTFAMGARDRARGKRACQTGNYETSTRACACAREGSCIFSILGVHKKGSQNRNTATSTRPRTQGTYGRHRARVRGNPDFLESIKKGTALTLPHASRAHARHSLPTSRAYARDFRHASRACACARDAIGTELPTATGIARVPEDRGCHG